MRQLEISCIGRGVLRRFMPIIMLVGLCWLVFVINNLLLNNGLARCGIEPRHLSGLPGIIWAPFLHGSFHHLAANTVPLLVLGAILCGRSKGEFALVSIGGGVLTGGLTWLFARNGCHLGASGLIFCFFGYIASLACFRRTFGTLILSLVCIVGYGGILKGLLPTSAAVSWEGHAAGLVAGIALAWVSSRFDKPRKDPEIKPLETKPGTPLTN